MSKNKVSEPLISQINGFEREQRIHKAHFYRGRHRFIPFLNRITVKSEDGVSSASWADLDLSSFVGKTATKISANTFAVQVLVILRDSASASSDTFVGLRKNGASGDATMVAQGYHINNTYMHQQGMVGLDEDYILEYQLGASGANTLTYRIYLVGYYEQIS